MLKMPNTELIQKVKLFSGRYLAKASYKNLNLINKCGHLFPIKYPYNQKVHIDHIWNGRE